MAPDATLRPLKRKEGAGVGGGGGRGGRRGLSPIESVSCSVSRSRCDKTMTPLMLPKRPSKSTFFSCGREKQKQQGERLSILPGQMIHSTFPTLNHPRQMKGYPIKNTTTSNFDFMNFFEVCTCFLCSGSMISSTHICKSLM